MNEKRKIHFKNGRDTRHEKESAKMYQKAKYLFAYFVHFYFAFHSHYVNLFVKNGRKCENVMNCAALNKKKISDSRTKTVKGERRNEHSQTHEQSHSSLFPAQDHLRM